MVRLKEVLENQKASQQSMHLTSGILRHFQAVSAFPTFFRAQAESTPAHPQVTQTVGQTFL
jgi:hypothetical protein